MYIQARDRGCVIVGGGIIVEGIPYPKGKRRLVLLSETRVAKGAGVEALLAAESFGIDDVLTGEFARMGAMPGDML
jgi:hypothetical protein